MSKFPPSADEVGISRAVLAERFRQPPLAYPTRWRLQLSAQMLRATSQSVAQIASKVGYDSEPAFYRAFKRIFGNPTCALQERNKTKTEPDQSGLRADRS